MSTGMMAGTCVILTLSNPREQIFGMLLDLGSSGILVRGLSVSSVDDWLRQIDGSREAPEGAQGLSTMFYPMHRIEKMALDEASYGAQPIHERFAVRTGLSFTQFIRDEPGAPADSTKDDG